MRRTMLRDGQELLFTPYGVAYTRDLCISTVSEVLITPPQYTYKEAEELATVTAPQFMCSLTAGIFQKCTNLKSAHFPYAKNAESYAFRECYLLEEVILGSIGHPVQYLKMYTFMYDSQSNLCITIYVSEDTELPMAEHPFGATNATIIYRSASTGEILEYEVA